MHFHYTAKAAAGDILTGLLEAQSTTEARQQLRQQGLFALTLVEQSHNIGTAIARKHSLFGSTRITKFDVLMFTSQLAIMTRSGIDLAEALQNVARQCRKPALKDALDAIYASVADGQTPSEAMKEFSHIFGDAYISSIAAGEASGRVPEVLNRLATLIRNEIRLKTTIRSVMAYPVIIMLVASVVIGALVFFVLPQFSQVFEDMGAPAPPFTQFLLDSAKAIRENVVLLAGLTFVALIGGVQYARSPSARRLRDRWILNAALIKNATQPLMTGRTFRLMGTMLQNGVPLLDTIRLCRSSVQNVLFRQLFDKLECDVLDGRGIATALNLCEFIPPGAGEMMSTAERTGKLGTVMETVGEFYEDDGDRQIREMARLIEPIIIVMLGMIVATVVISIMVPLLDFSTLSSQ